MSITVKATRFAFRQLLELDACTRCGECVKWCPTFAEKQELDEITPLRKIERIRSSLRAQTLGPLARLFGYQRATEGMLQSFSTGTYDCTLCGRCAVVCPVNIQTRSMWIAMRETLVDQGTYPEAMDHLRETVTTNYNISGDANAERLIWSQNLPEIPEGVGGKEQAEVVYFVGCVSSFYPQSYGIPQSMVQILEQGGVDYLTLGGEEWCCGFPLIIAGMGDAAVESVRHNVEAVRQTGAKRLVASCPSCYHTWKDEYPHILGEPLGFEVLHSTELLEELISAGKLNLKPLEETITYHDPCDLGRTSGIYDAPRNVIQRHTGRQLCGDEGHSRVLALLRRRRRRGDGRQGPLGGGGREPHRAGGRDRGPVSFLRLPAVHAHAGRGRPQQQGARPRDGRISIRGATVG